MDGSQVKILVALACLLCCCCCCCAGSERDPGGNAVREEDIAERTSGEVESNSGNRHCSSTGPEKLPVEVFEAYEGADGEREREELPGSPVDEETIRKAEKMADEDLLSGLNRILRNNETLADVFRAESIYENP